MLRKLELSHDAHRQLFSYCNERNIQFLSTPFDEEATDFLNELGVTAFKVSSGDLTNSPLLQHIALKGKPVILSTGMSNIDEVIEAVSNLRSSGCENVVLLHCVSSYPATAPDTNLRAMQTLTRAFDVPVGFSDHSQGIEIALAAVALGACVIEKHFTLDRNLPGPDHRASHEPPELISLIQGIRKVESALGSGKKVPTPGELATAKVARRSLIASRDIDAGTILKRDMIVIRRPGTGIPPTMLENVLGRRLRTNVATGSLFTLDMFGED
jgi:N,N'-diacetyllegionaminate synthase